jgi:hypothetical protein
VRVHASNGGEYTVKVDDINWTSSDSLLAPVVIPDGNHMMTFSAKSNGATFDFLTVDVGESTDLKGKKVIVDDTVGELRQLTFSGGWSMDPPAGSPINTTLLYNGTTHWSTTAGDSMTYNFAGKFAPYFVCPISHY